MSVCAGQLDADDLLRARVDLERLHRPPGPGGLRVPALLDQSCLQQGLRQAAETGGRQVETVRQLGSRERAVDEYLQTDSAHRRGKPGPVVPGHQPFVSAHSASIPAYVVGATIAYG